MTTYTCKCGKQFDGRGNSVTTGYRIPRTEYTPEHDCFGCPFVKGANAEYMECRGTRNTPIYETTASCVSSKASTLHVSSLDYDFIREMQDFYNSLCVEGPKEPPEPGMEDSSGRLQFSFVFLKNAKGESAKRQLIEHFFEAAQSNDTYWEIFARKDWSGYAEQFALYDKISAAKEQAKAAAAEQQTEDTEEAHHTMTQYLHHDKVYFVRQSDDGKFRVYFYYLANPPAHIPVGDIPSCDAEWIAQKMLDDYAQRREFEVYDPGSTGEENPEAEQQIFGDIPDSEDGKSETPENQDDLENDGTEELQEGCSWQNASGGEEEEQEDTQKNVPAGERVSLQDDAFYPLLAACDEKINRALRMAVDAQQGFTLTAKVTFEPRGSVFAVKYETGYQFDPIKVKDKGELYEDIQIALDDAGNPIIPYDREHQMTFDEVPSAAAPVVTQVDGSTGLVEKITVPEDVEQKPEPDENETVLSLEPEEALYPCDSFDCPFFGVPDAGVSGCCFDMENPEDADYGGDIWTAVQMHGCRRDEVLNVYHKNEPDAECDGEPEKPALTENNEEDYAS